MNRFLKLGIVLLLVLMIIAGCTEEDISNTELESQITLTPVDLFEGDGAKFKPFLGSMSGAFKLSYTGEKPYVTLNINKWENGEKTFYGAIENLFFSVEGNKQHTEMEVIIAVETINFGEDQDEYDVIKVGMVNEYGTSLGTFNTVRDKPLNVKTALGYAEPQTFNTEEPIHVWGIQASSEYHMQTFDFGEQPLEDLDWGLIFTLDFE